MSRDLIFEFSQPDFENPWPILASNIESTRFRIPGNAIENAREELGELLTEMPSLRSELDSKVVKQYGKARRAAAKETGLSIDEFPEACPYELMQLLDPEFLLDETSETSEA